MNRTKLIKELQNEKRKLEGLLKPKQAHAKLLKQFAKFCELEKEIQIQESYLQNER